MRHRLPWLGISLAIVVLDQITKAVLVRSIPLYGSPVSLIDGALALSHVRNYGAAFGFLSDPKLPYQGALFALLSLVALGAVVWYATQVPVRRTSLPARPRSRPGRCRRQPARPRATRLRRRFHPRLLEELELA